MRAPEFRTSAAEWDGQMGLVVNSPVMVGISTGALSQQGGFLVPFNGTIVQCAINVIAAPVISTMTLDIGTRADPDHFLDAYALASTIATGLHDLTNDAALVNTDVDAGDVIEFAIAAEGDSAAFVVAATLVIMPRQ